MDFEGDYTGEWVSTAFDGRHTGKLDVKIKAGRKNALRMTAVSEIFGKPFKIIYRTSASGKASLSVRNSNLRANNGAAIKGSGQGKFGKSKGTVSTEGTLFAQTTTADAVFKKTRNGIEVTGTAKSEFFEYFTFTFNGRKK